MLVEVKLQFFICKVDTKLFKTVVLVILKSKNVQNSYRASLELRKRGHYYSIYPKMSICYCALQLTQSWWFAGMTISKLEMDCPSSKSSFLLDNARQKDYRGCSTWTNKPSDFIHLFIPLFYKRITHLRWQFISSKYFNEVSHAGSEITTKVGPWTLTASSLEIRMATWPNGHGLSYWQTVHTFTFVLSFLKLSSFHTDISQLHLNPLSPTLQIQILQTDLHTFP